MFIFRFLFKSVAMWMATRLLGRFIPVLGRFLRVLRR
jgi:hypothetical protein